jgi:formamidopyrimidine-DNA glycosylase
MPELPEVETTRTSLLPLVGQTVQQVQVFQPQLRWLIPTDLARLNGQRLLRIDRRAKYLLAHFEQDALMMHLGMSGSFGLYTGNPDRCKHDHVLIDFDHTQLRYHDPRRFGSMLWLQPDGSHPLLARLGPEPLSDDFHADYLAQALRHKKTAIKVALMDNAIVVGVGNIYATEALFRTGIHPARPAHTLNGDQIRHVVEVIRQILQQAITLGGSTLRDFVNAQGENGYFQQTLLAYGRAGQPCGRCQHPLQTLKLGQRASAFCPVCQPAHNA